MRLKRAIFEMAVSKFRDGASILNHEDTLSYDIMWSTESKMKIRVHGEGYPRDFEITVTEKRD